MHPWSKERFAAKILNILLFGVAFYLTGCGTSRVLPAKQHKTLASALEESPVFGSHFTGFALYDPETRQMLYQQNADKYFTPASNTKIFTFYAASRILGDSLPVLHYLERGDSLIFRGAGNPLVLHPDFPSANLAIDFLRKRNKQLFFTTNNFQDDHFGAGWSWADYTYGYQAEKSAFPLYGNVVRLQTDNRDSLVRTRPDFFQPYLRYLYDDEAPRYRRAQNSLLIYLNRDAVRRDTSFETAIPMDQSPELTAALLQDALNRPVHLLSVDSIPQRQWKTLRQPLQDTLYRRLLHPSDNFVAEQLLLMCSDELFGVLDTRRAIEYARDSLLNDLPDPLEWWDGSGLSRYNLFTPRTMTALLDKIYEENPRERLFDLFPTGGVSGTIRNWYGGDPPYVFAKTGTLRNRHCLSGYLRTQSGRVLIFSFMHNNYTGSSTPVKKEMQRILELIRRF